jgi:hypothetical protein
VVAIVFEVGVAEDDDDVKVAAVVPAGIGNGEAFPEAPSIEVAADDGRVGGAALTTYGDDMQGLRGPGITLIMYRILNLGGTTSTRYIRLK